VSELPHELIAAFRATLLEAREADLLLHVIDVSDPFHAERRDEVEEVLDSIGAGELPVIRVYNKIDLTDQSPGIQRNGDGLAEQAHVSALRGTGLDELLAAIEERAAGQRIQRWIRLEGSDARFRARLFELGAVNEEQIAADGCWKLHVDLPLSLAVKLARHGAPDARTEREQLLPAESAQTFT
jgi:GTP-binding protein HflX